MAKNIPLGNLFVGRRIFLFPLFSREEFFFFFFFPVGTSALRFRVDLVVHGPVFHPLTASTGESKYGFRKLIPPALVFFPGHAWEGSLNLGLRPLPGCA